MTGSAFSTLPLPSAVKPKLLGRFTFVRWRFGGSWALPGDRLERDAERRRLLHLGPSFLLARLGAKPRIGGLRDC